MQSPGDGQRPVCERCRIKKLECRLPSKTTRFIKSSEVCFDKAIPLGAPDGLDPPPGDPPGDPLGRNVGTGDGPSSLDGSPREEESVGSPAQAGMPSHHHHLEMLADAATAGGWVGGNDAAVAATVPFPRPNDRILSLPTVVSYGLEHGVSPPQTGYPADAGMLSGGGVENTHPAITAAG
ncbi:hypothetical protein GMORB2_1682 [Geosmithia morbida]|uniref:Uncharacterized protein n=1 Tax=Geosmithia morbida TaxID=1094350 RepID=A0A9P4YSR5_9HYPO|nr:uncharacterized protein GMORB2_1682 [Geosmithia morbida]KAF4121842.1 hypothetical protein GMORB2_1682 [Geosmithia morbida]